MNIQPNKVSRNAKNPYSKTAVQLPTSITWCKMQTPQHAEPESLYNLTDNAVLRLLLNTPSQ
jgi:hypothetical protein